MGGGKEWKGEESRERRREEQGEEGGERGGGRKGERKRRGGEEGRKRGIYLKIVFFSRNTATRGKNIIHDNVVLTT
jgi:hypothetical protein